MKLTTIYKASILGLAAGLGFMLAGCSTSTAQKNADSKQGGDHIKVVATTGYLGDAVANIAPDADLTVLVKPGGDPHTQELTTKDTEAIDQADLVIWTSHDMEHKMMAQLDKLGKKSVPAAEAIPESDLLPWEEDGKVEGHDPHVWNSPDNWKHVVTRIGQALGEVDQANKASYEDKAKAYNEQIDKAKAEAKKLYDEIPAERRVLITGHDAFNYLGKTFGIEIHATDFVSSEAEMSQSELEKLASLIAEKKIPVIFQDNLKNPEVIKNLQKAVESKGWKVTVSDKELFADSLSAESPTNTYLGAFAYNAKTIHNALTGGK